MKVLSLWQPWASLVVMGAKKYELRNWQTRYRGLLLIHASSKKPNKADAGFFEKADFFRDHISSIQGLPYGAIIGKVELTQIVTTDWLLQNMETDPNHNWEQEFAFDDYSPNRFAWKMENPESIPPIGAKGTLGLWEFPYE
jgi:hypothetical protein